MNKRIEHEEAIGSIVYTLSIEQDDQPVRGNAANTGVNEWDRQCEDDILQRLKRNDVWAWCVVTVTASIEREGVRFEGQEFLGQCSYEDSLDFRQGGYWEDMKKEAKEKLEAQLLREATRGTYALEILDEHFGVDLEGLRRGSGKYEGRWVRPSGGARSR